jgi:long-chain acyl-CoA synthetase
MLAETIPALFVKAVRTFDKPDAFRRKADGVYRDVSHRETFELVRKATCGLLALGLVKGDRIAILSENRLEWAVADLAILSAGCVNVPIYPTLPPGQVEFILRDAEVRAAFVSGRSQLEKIDAARKSLPHVRHIFSFERVAGQTGVLTLEDLMEHGAATGDPSLFEERIATIGADDWASVIYTSGTTGDPKGVVLTHSNFVSNVIGCTEAFHVDARDSFLSFLTLSHALERTGGYYVPLFTGATIAYAENFGSVLQNLQEVRPTFLVSVPRFFERVHSRIMDKAARSSPAKRRLFFWAVGIGKTRALQPKRTRGRPDLAAGHWIAERLVFRKLRAQTGGRLRFCISGGAPLPKEIAEFFLAIGLHVLEGYGTTEASPVLAVNTFQDFKIGAVGKPLPGVEIAIADDGEILARGPNIMHGYFNKPALTGEVLRDGWYHTGDIGHIDSDGFLVITDRKKDLLVTSGGKKVAPQLVESLLRTSDYISEAILVGDARKFVSAIIVPDFEHLRAYADSAGIAYQSDAELVRQPAVVKKIGEEIANKSRNLAGYERVRKFILREKNFSLEDNELTPTFKIKRRVVEKEYQNEIDALYRE